MKCKKYTTWKNRSIDYSKCEYLPDENSNSNENMLFLRKTDEAILSPPPFLRKTPFQLTLFMTPLSVQILKLRYPSLNIRGEGEETMS